MVELPPADTGVSPFVVVGDLDAAEHSALPEHTFVVAEPSTSDYIADILRTMVVPQTVVAAAAV